MDTFKSTYLDMSFPMELREAKLEEFIILKEGKLSIKEYSLNFSLFYKYAPTFVENPET